MLEPFKIIFIYLNDNINNATDYLKKHLFNTIVWNFIYIVCSILLFFYTDKIRIQGLSILLIIHFLFSLHVVFNLIPKKALKENKSLNPTLIDLPNGQHFFTNDVFSSEELEKYIQQFEEKKDYSFCYFIPKRKFSEIIKK